ncbi:MAG: VanZ family protein [Clostridiales bacterium]|nr:VanZ family protein [Clostridiales bacterium]
MKLKDKFSSLTTKGKLCFIFKYGVLAAFILCALVLCIESLMPGSVSSQHSSSFGDLIDLPVNKIIEPTDVELYTAEGEGQDVFVGQSVTLIPVFTPLNATYKQTEWSVSDDEVAELQGDIVTFIAPGEVTVTVKSDYNKSVTSSMTFFVSEVTVEGIQLDDIPSLVVGQTVFLSATVMPENATNKDYTFTTDSDCVITDGNLLTSVKAGTATITVTSMADPKISDSVEVEISVIEAESLGFYLGGSAVMEIDLVQSESAELSLAIFPEDTTYQDIIWNGTDGIEVFFFSLTEFKITATEVGTASITAKLGNELEATLIVNVSPADIGVDEIIGLQASDKTLELGHGGSVDISPITSNGNAGYYKYLYTVTEGEDIISVNDLGLVKALKVGIAKLQISVIGTEISTEVTVTVIGIVIDSLSIIAPQNLKVDRTYTLRYEILPQAAAFNRVTWSVSDDTIATISEDGKIRFDRAGSVTVTASSGDATTSTVLTAKNVLKISKIKALGFERFSNFNDGIAYATLKQNTSARFSVIFGQKVTYRIIDIESSDSEILVVTGHTVTALEKGDVTLTITYWDGDETTIPIIYTVDISIVEQTLSDLTDNWGRTVRKGIGHFGAFMVTGIFAVLTFMFFIKNKFVAALLTLISGFSLAGLTELLQKITPNRGPSFADVILDFEGFCFSAIPIFIVFIIVYTVKYFKNRKKD